MDRGDSAEKAWDELIAEQIRLRGRLWFRLAYRVLGNTAKAEDVCQQAILKALQVRPQLRDPAALQGWLAKVVINESLSVRRREQAEQRARASRTAKSNSHTCGPSGGDLRESLYGAIVALPQPTQAIVVLRLMQGMSGNQVAELLDMHACDVSRRLHAGLDFLRQRIAPDFEIDSDERIRMRRGDQ